MMRARGLALADGVAARLTQLRMAGSPGDPRPDLVQAAPARANRVEVMVKVMARPVREVPTRRSQAALTGVPDPALLLAGGLIAVGRTCADAP